MVERCPTQPDHQFTGRRFDTQCGGSGQVLACYFYDFTKKQAQHYAGPDHQYSDDNQVSSHHPSFTEVMVKGRVSPPVNKKSPKDLRPYYTAK